MESIHPANSFVLNFCPTGAVARRGDHPGLPLTPGEICDAVLAAAAAGATIAHLHARDADGLPTCEADVFADIIQRIRQHDRQIVLCVSLSGRFESEPGRRGAALELEGELKPDMASLTLSSLNFSRQASVSEPSTITALASRMKERGVVPECEIFDLGMTNYLRYLMDRNLIVGPVYANIILGNIATAQTDLSHAGLLVKDLPPGCCWAFGGIGRSQTAAAGMALAAGGGVRIGLEDNLYADRDRTRLATNSELIQRTVDLAALHERTPMTPAAFRHNMAILSGDGHYGRDPGSSPRI